jgi:PadR family transcriptional regulator, regulatory protein PadR
MSEFRSASKQTRNLLGLMLSMRVQWLHGYELAEQCGLRSGTLYPILMRLSDRGMLESRWEPSLHPGRPLRKLYRLTAQGVSYAKEHSHQAIAGRQVLAPRRAW